MYDPQSRLNAIAHEMEMGDEIDADDLEWLLSMAARGIKNGETK